jgi:hypothetical protein
LKGVIRATMEPSNMEYDYKIKYTSGEKFREAGKTF